MEYCKDTRRMLAAYQRETDAQIYALQRKVYELQSRLFSLEMERHMEKNCQLNNCQLQTDNCL